MKKRFTAVLLIAGLILTLIPAALADSSSGRIRTYSHDLVTFIEYFEGFEEKAVLDQGQYYIGYGMLSETQDPEETITQEQAEQDLIDYLDREGGVVDQVNAFLEENDLPATQGQYDAMCSLVYNKGISRLRESGIREILKKGVENCDELYVVNTFAQICRTYYTKVALVGLIYRRVQEAEMFLFDEYDVPKNNQSTRYKWLLTDANGGQVDYDVYCYKAGQTYGSLPQPTRSGYKFAGWKVTAVENTASDSGRILTASDTADADYTIQAQWTASDGTDTGSAHSAVCPSRKFTDVSTDPNNWYHAAVDHAVESGYMDGVSGTSFAPNGSVTRAQLVQILYAMEGKPSSAEASFSDVTSDKWYAAAIGWASKYDIVSGYEDGTFKPDQAVTRQQMISILYKYADHKNYTLNDSGDLSWFPDADELSVYAVTPMKWAIGHGLISGTGKGIEPKGTTTRAQAAVILNAFDSNIANAA